MLLFIIHLKNILSTTGHENLEFRFVALSNRVSILPGVTNVYIYQNILEKSYLHFSQLLPYLMGLIMYTTL